MRRSTAAVLTGLVLAGVVVTTGASRHARPPRLAARVSAHAPTSVPPPLAPRQPLSAPAPAAVSSPPAASPPPPQSPVAATAPPSPPGRLKGPAPVADPPATSSCQGPRAANLGPGQSLGPRQCLGDGGATLTMASSGQLVATEGTTVFWAEPRATVAVAGSSATMTPSGRLVVTTPGGRTTWHSQRQAAGDCLLAGSTLEKTGSMIVDAPGDPGGWWPLWSVVPCYSGDPAGARVLVVGDSITWLATPRILSVLDPRYQVQVSGMSTFEFAQQVPALESLLQNPGGAPADVVVELGTNDVLRSNGAWSADMTELLSLIPPSTCTVIVEVADLGPGLSDPSSAEVDAGLSSWVAEHPSARLLAWNKMLDRGDHAASWLDIDHVHPDAQGERVLAGRLDQSLASCPSHFGQGISGAH